MKPKTNRAGDKNKSNTFDFCQTPYYALDPLLPYLPKSAIIWESAVGDGQITNKLWQEGYSRLLQTDILTGKNFFEYEPYHWQIQLTNPPYSVKYQWVQRSYELNKPFALLLPLETLGAAKGQRLFEKYGIEIILFDKRVNFKMPDIGYSGNGAQFPTAWFTWGLNIGQQLIYGKVTYYADEQGKLL